MKTHVTLALSLAALAACSSPPTDVDGDGVAPPADCNDNDATINPSQTEVCDGKDNNCDAMTDEGCGCVPGSAPQPCGATGACRQACSASGQLALCLPVGATTVDLMSDASNCGTCGKACGAAAPLCVAGACTPAGPPSHRGGTSSGASLGSQTMTNASFTHVGVLGDGAPRQSNANFVHSGGFTSGLR